MTIAIDHRGFAVGIPQAWLRPLGALALAWLAILVLFHRDVAHMATIAWTVSTYSHCLLVPAVVAWLVWQRRTVLAGMAPRPWSWAALWLAGGGLGWLLGDAAGVALARHLGIVMMLQGAAMTLLGRAVARQLRFAIGYALFAVPFGDFLVQPLQMLTARMCIGLLDLFGVPFWTDGVLIRIPNGYFEVAEACAGVNFVLAMTAFATLAAYLSFTSWRRRLAFMAFALALPVVANGVRAFATIYVAWWTSAEAATGFDHIVYGWVFFALITIAVVVIAWRFYDPAPAPAPAVPAGRVAPARAGPFATALAAVLALVAAPVAWSAVGQARAATLAARDLPVLAGWSGGRQAAPAWRPRYAGADLRMMGHYRDRSEAVVDLAIAAYARQAEGREMVGFGQGAIAPDGAWMWTSPGRPVAQGRSERITGPGGVVREVVTFYRVDGRTTGSATEVKLRTLKIRLLGGDPAAVAVTVSSTDPAALRRFLAALGPVDRLADGVVAR